jgi:broad specificity phosphatase PhoE
LSQVWLIRHGQAGLRSNYDTLSATGEEQARLLGEWLRPQRFDHVIAGGLNRQQETARLAGFAFEVDAGWSEFDLDAVYREIAPQIAAVDAAFREEYEGLLRDVVDDEHPVHRKWTRGDVMVVRAWMDGSVPVRSTETFGEFQERVRGAFARLLLERSGNVAVFTSATPIALALAGVLGVGAGQAMRLAGSLMNASCSVVRAGSEPSLFGFNHAAHLPPELHTFR